MSPRLVLSLLCFSLLLLSVVQPTHAGAELRVDEGRTRVLLEKEVVEVFLAVDNSSNQTLNVKVQLELLDPANRVASQLTQAHYNPEARYTVPPLTFTVR